MTRVGVDVVTDELGHVRIDAAGRPGDLQMTLTADDAGGRAALGDRLAELREELRSSGVDLTSLDVSTGDGAAGRAAVEDRLADRPAETEPPDEVGVVADPDADLAPEPDAPDRLDLRL